MATDLADALASAYLSWQGNYTTGDKRWKLKQLHNLYRLIIDHRDEMIASLSTSVPKHVHEQECARLVGDISQHISLVSQVGSHSSTELSFVGKFDITYRPFGRNLIISGHVSPFRWILGPLAASLADGNVTIIATTTENKGFVSILSREWSRYLDRDSIFLTTSFVTSELDLAEIDKATIYDTSIDTYRTILSSPKVRFVDTSDLGLNAVLITEGKKLWPRISNEIRRASDLEFSDRLHVVFVREEDAKPLEASLSQSVTTVALDDVVGKQAGTDLESRIKLVKDEGSLLIVIGKSLEGFTDALIGLSTPIAQLAILGPQESKVYEFVRRWVPARLVSVGSICSITLPDIDGSQKTPLLTTFIAPHSFSVPVYTCRHKVARTSEIIADIRASYQRLVKPLKPEPLGERIGFFDQVDYFVKGTGVLVGVLAISGLYLAFCRFR